MQRCRFPLCRALKLVAVVVALALQLSCICLAAPRIAAAGQSLPQSITDRVLALSYRYHLAEQEAQSLLKAFENAMKNGAPLDPLVRKMEEGLAKNVSSARIVSVINSKVERMRQLAEIVREREPAVEKRAYYLERMEDIASMGVPVSEIKREILRTRDRPVNQVLNALESNVALCRAGVPEKAAAEVMAAGLATGYFKDSAIDLARVVRAATESGVSPNTVARVSRDVAAGRLALQAAARELGVDYDATVAAKSRSGSITNSGQMGQGRGYGSGAGGSSGGQGRGGGSGNGGSGGGSGGGNRK